MSRQPVGEGEGVVHECSVEDGEEGGGGTQREAVCEEGVFVVMGRGMSQDRLSYPWTFGSTWSFIRCISRSSFIRLFLMSPVVALLADAIITNSKLPPTHVPRSK